MFKIDRGPKSERLYNAEEERTRAVTVTAKEWLELMQKLNRPVGQVGVEYDLMFDIAVPQALFDTLDSFQHRSSIPAAAAFLEQCMREGDDDAKVHRSIVNAARVRRLVTVLMDLAQSDDNFRPCWCPKFGQPDHDEHTPACASAQDVFDEFIAGGDFSWPPKPDKERA